MVESHSGFFLQGPGMPGVPPSGGGFSPGQSQVSNQDKEKVCFSHLANNYAAL